MYLAVVFGAFLACLLQQTSGHGMMLDPINRSSMWRYDDSYPQNYDDNQNYCGGMNVQHNTFGGKCGVCGDTYSDPHPQANENTGKYGLGKIAADYESGSTITVAVRLTTNHKGFFNYSLCALDNDNTYEPEDCFQDLKLVDGANKFEVESGINDFENQVVLPEGLTCSHCVLRWTYTAGNNWGICDDGTGAAGCGPQETFRSCADVAIH